MKRVIISLLLGAIVLTGAAQQSLWVIKDMPPSDTLSFSCQIEGEDTTLPCRWIDLERLGWSFANIEDGEAHTSTLIIRDYTHIQVVSPQKREAKMLFCNLSNKELTRKESMVYGIVYLCPESQVIAYDFKIKGGIIGGKSKESDVIDAYGKAKLEQYYPMHKSLQYSENEDDNEITIVVAKTSVDSISQGTVIGFRALANQELARLITQAGNIISDKEDRIERNRCFYEQNIALYTQKLQQAEADSSLLETVPYIKWAMAINYYDLGDYATSFKWMLQSAEAGFDEAQFSIGTMYWLGDGIELDNKSTVMWLEKAAEQGHIKAMTNLAIHYGTGEDSDNKKVFQWSLKAAQAGNAALYVLIGDYYRDGIDSVKQDYKQAFFWYEKATQAGDKIGMYNLAYLYSHGLGVKRNYTKSFDLLAICDKTQHYVQQALGEHYYYGRAVEKDIDKALFYFNKFIKFAEGDFYPDDDIKIPRLLTKELEEAQKIVKKHQK